MKKQLLFIWAFISVLGCTEKLPEKIHFFDSIDLKSGEYKLLVYGLEGLWIEDYRDFYIDDVKTLEKMKKQWVFTRKVDPKPCGYGYSIYLVNNDSILKKIWVNIDCEYGSDWVKFPKRYLNGHKASFKRMTEEESEKFNAQYFRKQ